MRVVLASAGAGLRTMAVGLALAYLAAAAWLLWWVLLAAVVPGWTPVAITSGSMAPSIRTGDVVVAAATHPASLQEGEVIVFADGAGGLLTHRIAGVEPGATYRTKGDANAVEDVATVAGSDVRGRGRLLVPVVARPVVWVQQGRWEPLLALVAATAAAGLVVTSWWPADPCSSRGGRQGPTDRERDLIAFAWGGAPT